MDFLGKLLIVYSREAKSELDDFGLALQKSDSRMLRTCLHRLKSVAAAAGATALKAACETILNRPFDDVMEDGPRILETLTTVHNESREAIFDYQLKRSRSVRSDALQSPVRLKVISSSNPPGVA